MNTLFLIIWVVWLLSEILLNRIFTSPENESKKYDKHSLLLIWIVIVVAILTASVSVALFDVPISNTGYIPYTGLLLIIAGMIIRLIAVRTLGKFFTVKLTVHKDQHLVKNGLYKYIRHPSYAGSLLSFAGCGLSMNNWISLVVVTIPVFLAFTYRIQIEEKLLESLFNKEFLEYKKHTKRVIPMVY